MQAAVAVAFQVFDPRMGGLGDLTSSSSQVFGLTILVACALGSGIIALLSLRSSFPANKFFNNWWVFLLIGILLAVMVVLPLSLIEGLSRTGASYRYTRYAEALSTPGLFLIAFGLELASLGAFRQRAKLSDSLDRLLPGWSKALPFLAALAILAVFAMVTRIGIHDIGGHFYGYSGVPLLEWQILLAVAAAITLAVWTADKKTTRLDWILFAVLWAGTAVLWLSQPVNPGGYALTPRPPNWEIYPYSDPQNYDWYAQTLLDGSGFNGQIPPRPLYVTFLAGMHALVGLEYTHVIVLQTLLLAIFPAVIYILGCRFASRPVGLMMALLIALRDVTSNWVAPFTQNISYSKLYLSELPTALLLVLFSIIMLTWSRRGLKGWVEPLLAGGVLGLATLIRTQSLIVLPAALLLLLISRPRAWRAWLSGSILAFLALCFTILPWLWRNHQVTGGWVFDDPVTQTMVLAERYSNGSSPETLILRPGESSAQYTSRLYAFALDSLRRDPLRIARAAASHWANNLAGSLRIFPIRTRLSGLRDFLIPSEAYWETRLEQHGPGLASLFLLVLAIFGLGLARVWGRMGWLGMLPLVINLSYNLWSALFITSGERFILPVDWAFLLYLCVGLLWILSGFIRLIPRAGLFADELVPLTPDPVLPPARLNRPLAGLLLAGLFFVGAVIPLAERLVPPRYPPVSQAELLTRMTAAGLAPELAKGLTILQGRALHPIYFPSGGGIPVVEDTGYHLMPQSRLIFRIAGPQSTLAMLALDAPPDFFPNGADVLALGQFKDGLFVVQSASVEYKGQRRLWMAAH